MTPLPQPVGEAELSLVTDTFAYRTDTRVNIDADGTNIAADNITFGEFYPNFEDGDAITLDGLFKWRGEDIDPVQDARVAPGHFTTSCGFRAELVLAGGNCSSAFGWYNVPDPLSETPPVASEIYTTVPDTIGDDLLCQPPLGSGSGFCPLAWDNVNPRQLNEPAWTPKAFESSFSDDPNYAGGYIAFALLANDYYCPETKYSLLQHNQRNGDGVPWVTVVIYASTVDPNGYYLAFEDLPMSPADWHETGVAGLNGTNDGDFNDFVYFVTGAGCRLCAGDCPPDTSSTGSGGSGGNATNDSSNANGTSDGSNTSGSGASGSGASGSVSAGGGPGSGATTGSADSGTSGSGSESGPGSGSGASGGTLGAAGDSGDATRTSCTPGRQVRCACPGSAEGAQTCNEDGDGYEPCQCSSGSADGGGCGCRLPGNAAPRGVPSSPSLLLLGFCVALARRNPRWVASRARAAR